MQRYNVTVKTEDDEFDIIIRDPQRALPFMKGTPYDSKGTTITLRKPSKDTYSVRKVYSIVVKQTLSRANCGDYDQTFTYADCLQEG